MEILQDLNVDFEGGIWLESYTACLTWDDNNSYNNNNNNNNNDDDDDDDDDNNNNNNNIVIVFKGAIWDFFLQSPHCAANCLQHVCSSGQGAIVCKSRPTHRALITCNMSCVTWYEAIKFDRVEIAFILYLKYGKLKLRSFLWQEQF